MAGNATTSPPWPQSAFGALYDGPSRNGLMRPKAVRGSGVAMVNMGEIFAHDRIGDVPMERVPLSEAEAERFLLQDGDLLFARASLTLEGAGKVAILLPAPYPRTFESHIIRVRLDRRRVTPSFYYYFFRSPIGRTTMTSIVEQVSAAGIRASDLATLPVPLPPLPEQRAIAGVLGALDDKIELNRKKARVLEGIARAVFTSWFVDFDPVRRAAAGKPTGLSSDLAALFPKRLVDSPIGEVPEGWRVGTLGELLSLSRDAIDPGEHPNEEFDHFSIPAFDAGQMPSRDRGDTIKSQKFVVTANCVLVSKLNPRTPRVWLPPAAASRRQVASTEFLVCTGNKAKHIGREFACCLATSSLLIEHLTTHASGTSNSHQRVRPQDFLDFQCVQPTADVLHAFTQTAMPTFDRIAVSRAQSATLVALRDTLLPKLISGELRIADAEKIVGRAL